MVQKSRQIYGTLKNIILYQFDLVKIPGSAYNTRGEIEAKNLPHCDGAERSRQVNLLPICQGFR